jgi:hypothetical protein
MVRGPMIAAVTAGWRRTNAMASWILAGADEIGEGAERLIDVRLRVGTVDLVQVDPVGAQPPQRVLNLAHDPPA